MLTRQLLAEGEVAELEVAMTMARASVDNFGDLGLVEVRLARALLRMGDLYVAMRDRDRAAAAPSEVAALTAQRDEARERIRDMMRQYARLAAQQEQAIELMLAMLVDKEDRICNHPEWVSKLTELTGADQ